MMSKSHVFHALSGVTADVKSKDNEAVTQKTLWASSWVSVTGVLCLQADKVVDLDECVRICDIIEQTLTDSYSLSRVWLVDVQFFRSTFCFVKCSFPKIPPFPGCVEWNVSV